MQWKLPGKFSQWIQRAGRAARGRGRVGLAVLLVERSAYSIDLCADVSAKRVRRSAATPTTRKATKKSAAQTKAIKKYAIEHGLQRGVSAEMDNLPLQGEHPPLDVEREDEGLLTFVQSTKCRRSVWANAFMRDFACGAQSLDRTLFISREC